MNPAYDSTVAPFMPLLAFLLSYGGGYLLGSIPFGLLLTKLAGMGDIRAIGSGNIGATNVLRTGKKGLAALTLVLDALKGAVAVWLGLFYTPILGLVAGAAAMLGHSYPIWLNYKGGKGVATAFGISCALDGWLGLAVGVSWLVVLLITRYSSLAALLAATLSPLYAWLFARPDLVPFYLGLMVFIWWRHRANVRRLWDGSETKIGAKAVAAIPEPLPAEPPQVIHEPPTAE